MQVISVDLSEYSPNGANNVFKYRDILTEGNVEIRVSGVADSIGFFVVQLHTYLYPVMLSTVQNNVDADSINGTNVGFVQVTNGASQYKFFVKSDPSIKISALISVVVYDNKGKLHASPYFSSRYSWFAWARHRFNHVTNNNKTSDSLCTLPACTCFY